MIVACGVLVHHVQAAGLHGIGRAGGFQGLPEVAFSPVFLQPAIDARRGHVLHACNPNGPSMGMQARARFSSALMSCRNTPPTGLQSPRRCAKVNAAIGQNAWSTSPTLSGTGYS